MSDTLAPEDLQDVRAFGSTEPISVAEVYNDKMQQLKDNLTATMEFHRLGAIKGVVLDANGTTVLHDIFNTFGAHKEEDGHFVPKDGRRRCEPHSDEHPQGQAACRGRDGRHAVQIISSASSARTPTTC